MHGFALDEKRNKMSKSVGNVVSPRDVVEGKAMGVDVLRWWVASHASSNTSVMVGDNNPTASKTEVDRMRNTLRFILGQLEGAVEEELTEERRVLLDRALLDRLLKYITVCGQFYEAMEYNKVCIATTNFLTSLSSSYIHPVKDRLYCDSRSSLGWRSGAGHHAGAGEKTNFS